MDELALDTNQVAMPTGADAQAAAADADAAIPAGKQRLVDQLKPLYEKVMSSPRGRLYAVFGIGLLVGWIVLGWLLFPVQWSNTDPWDMRKAHQERFVLMLAEYYWETQDLGFVLESINGWDRGDLDAMVANLSNAKDGTPAQRQQLSALGEALSLPMHEQGLMSTLMSNSKGLLLAVALALIPILGGVGVVLVLAIKQAGAPTIEQELADLEEELGFDVSGLKEDEIWDEDGEEEDDEDDEDDDDEEERGGSGLAAMAAETDGVDEEISDMLSTFFDDDDTSLEALQALSKGLMDVNAETMARTMKAMVTVLEHTPPQRDRPDLQRNR